MLWTRDAVAELIYDRFKVRLSKWTVGRLLMKWALNKEELKKNLVGYLRGRQKRPDLVKRDFHHKHVHYAA